MKGMHVIAAVAVMVCGLMLAPAVQAEEGGWGGKRGEFRKKMEERMENVLSQLGLSEEQKKQLDENKKRHKEAAQSLRKRLRENMEVMEEEFAKEPLDMAKIDTIRASSKALRDQMMDERFQSILEVRKILTREQFLKFSSLIKEHRRGG